MEIFVECERVPLKADPELFSGANPNSNLQLRPIISCHYLLAQITWISLERENAATLQQELTFSCEQGLRMLW